MTMKLNVKQALLSAAMWMCCMPLWAQTTKEEMFATIEKTGGVYWAYPLDRPSTDQGA